MNVVELRAELARMGLPTNGSKKTLQNRLAKTKENSGLLSSPAKMITSPESEIRVSLRQMFLQRLFTDVKIIIISSRGDGSESSIEMDLHRLILVHRCVFFGSMFTRTFRESDEENVTLHTAEGSTVATMAQVLEYLYTGEISVSGENVLEIMAAADKLQISSLRESCEEYLEQNLCPTSVCAIWKACSVLGLDRLARKCKAMVVAKGKEVLPSAGFSELPRDLVVSTVSDSSLTATEEVVFEAVVAWGEANKGAASVRDSIMEFIPHLRFDEMEHAFLHTRVRQSGFVSSEVIMDALVRIVDDLVPQVKPNTKRAFAPSKDDQAGASSQPKKRRLG